MITPFSPEYSNTPWDLYMKLSLLAPPFLQYDLLPELPALLVIARLLSHHIIFHMATFASMRRSELLALRWHDVGLFTLRYLLVSPLYDLQQFYNPLSVYLFL